MPDGLDLPIGERPDESPGRTGSTPRQRTHYSKIARVFPDDFPKRLLRFKEESSLPWAELTCRLGTYPSTIKRWKNKGYGPTRRTGRC